jgi:phosphodiesterase/alkaline phosphatase D-like protein
MKTTKSICVFILGCLSTVAATAAGTPSDSAKHHGRDWTHTRLEQVAAVLPQPVANKAQIATPAKVSLETPKFLASIAGTEVKLEWTKSENAKAYHLQVSKDAGFNNSSMYIVNEKNLSDTSFEIKNLEPDTKYFWRVAAFNNELKAGYTKSNFTSSAFSTK